MQKVSNKFFYLDFYLYMKCLYMVYGVCICTSASAIGGTVHDVYAPTNAYTDIFR